MKNTPEFDSFSNSYDELLKDPIRDRFSQSSEYFHRRKRDLIRSFFKQRRANTEGLSYLDLGCGKGELLRSLASDFKRVCGCDFSSGMLQHVQAGGGKVETRVQTDPNTIPFDDASFDFVSAVCVYHHVPPEARDALTMEVKRVLNPGGVFSIIEHNPFNPITQLIVSRTPVDADAHLLTSRKAQNLLRKAGFSLLHKRFFLYLPEGAYKVAGGAESLLQSVPLGGQFAVFGQKN